MQLLDSTLYGPARERVGVGWQHRELLLCGGMKSGVQAAATEYRRQFYEDNFLLYSVPLRIGNMTRILTLHDLVVNCIRKMVI